MRRKQTGFLIVWILLASCSFFTDQLEDVPWFPVKDKPALSLVFSHNVNGETHPCGCRHFPLGGLPQVAGKLAVIEKKHDLIYVDTGDMLFPSSALPAALKKSLTFAAGNLARGMDLLGLDYFVPGEQDFAAGVEFLAELSHKAKFTFLIANLKDSSIKHKKWAVISKNAHRFYLIGLVDPVLLSEKYQSLFISPSIAFKKVIQEIKEEGYLLDSPFHRLIVLSHSGMKMDESLASQFSQIDWILGAHSQDFTSDPVKEKNTRLVQVLSRNHYLGEVIFSLWGSKSQDSFKIHDINDKLKDEIKPNPFFSFIDDHKSRIKKIQLTEQRFTAELTNKDPMATAASCIECHQQQSDHWSKTHHAIAYITLIKSNEEKNLRCLQCHTVGLNDPRGYQRAADLVRFAKKLPFDYWEAFGKEIRFKGPVRSLSAERTKDLAMEWQKFDKKHGITHNYANVQCLNCHSKHPDHPFDTQTVQISENKKKEHMRQKCLECHDRDQSPQWYHKNQRGLAGKINGKKLSGLIKKIGCPLMKN